MEKTEFQFHRLEPEKGTVVFTWDDNCISHKHIIAPIFSAYNCGCTFYINPGEPDFESGFFSSYKYLSIQGFEIGSHGKTHHHLSRLSDKEYIDQIATAREKIKSAFCIQPTTFAFPHHDFNAQMLSQVRHLYFETRNSLYNSIRFSLKSATRIEQVNSIIESAANDKFTLIFSGHGAFSESDNSDIYGYEPINSHLLCQILESILRYREVQVCTFEQAALKTYLLYHCETDRKSAWISNLQLDFLRQYGLSKERIFDLI